MSNLNSIPWSHYQDIQVSDLETKKLFDQKMLSGKYSEALDILKNNKDELKGKAYISDTINKIFSGVYELQSYFNTGANIFLSDLAIFYFNAINNFKTKGVWNETLQYSLYNFVEYNNDIYMALKDVPVGTLPTEKSHWLKLGLRGNKGSSGVNVSMRYEWISTKNYTLNDIVAYKGNLYVALKSNINKKPDEDSSSWLVFLLVIKDGINVGINPPSKFVQNTVWFKTESNPLESTIDLSGEFYRYTANGEWEIMYPATIFTKVIGNEKYTLKAITEDIQILPNNWIWSDLDKAYEYAWKPLYAGEESIIKIFCNKPTNGNIFSKLRLKMIDNNTTILFFIKNLPKTGIYLKAKYNKGRK